MEIDGEPPPGMVSSCSLVSHLVWGTAQTAARLRSSSVHGDQCRASSWHGHLFDAIRNCSTLHASSA
jgi:hypothetical protein